MRKGGVRGEEEGGRRKWEGLRGLGEGYKRDVRRSDRGGGGVWEGSEKGMRGKGERSKCLEVMRKGGVRRGWEGKERGGEGSEMKWEGRERGMRGKGERGEREWEGVRGEGDKERGKHWRYKFDSSIYLREYWKGLSLLKSKRTIGNTKKNNLLHEG